MYTSMLVVVVPVNAPRRLLFALAIAHSRLPSALWVGHRAASHCRRLQVDLLLRIVCGVVGCWARYESVKWRVVHTSTRRTADATPHSHTAPNGGKQNHTNAERNNNQGTSALLSSPMFGAPQPIRVLRSHDTMSSQQRMSHDLAKIPNSLTT